MQSVTQMQVDLLFTLNIRMEKNVIPVTFFNHDMDVGARWTGLSVSETKNTECASVLLSGNALLMREVSAEWRNLSTGSLH